MKNILLLALLVISAGVFAQENKTVSTYYLIRHAEKAAQASSSMAEAGKLNAQNPDPELSPEGFTRAEKWAEVFQYVRFDAIYSTNYIRTKETAKPTAGKQGLEIILYNPKDFDFSRFKAETMGKTILIVGHSNTIPGFVNHLTGEEKYGNMEENNHSNLYIVQIIGDQTTDQVLCIK